MSRSPISVMRVIGRLVLAVALCGIVPAPAGAAAPASSGSPPRFALVMGNGSYPTMPLENPVNDARAMAEALQGLGFKVTKVENGTLKSIHEAIRDFGEQLRANGGVGLFFYAGHGLQVKGHNYLLPVDANIKREDEVPYQSIDAEEILAKMESAKNPLNLIILDACRDNPFARSTRSAGSTGLAQMEAPVGSLIAFATAPGAQASDGAGKNSIYTQNLLRHMREPGLPVEEVFKRVRVDVRVATSNRQIPWENTSLEHNFYFVPAAGTSVADVSPVTKGDPDAIEQQAWTAVEKGNKPSDYQAYLERYPGGRHAAQARTKIASAEPSQRDAAAGSAAAVNEPARPTTQVAMTQPQQNPPRPSGFGSSGPTQGFSFSAAEEKTRMEVEGGKVAFAEALNTPCAPAKKRARISLGIAEHYMHPGGTAKSGGAFTAGLADRLRRAGLSVQMGGKADYYLSGNVTSEGGMNRTLFLNEVSLSAALYLSNAAGRPVSEVVSREDSFAGNDISSVMMDLMRRQADSVAAKLYTDFCRAT